MLKYHYLQTSISIYCELLSIFYCDLPGCLNNGGSWVNMHWPTTHVTHPKSDPFDPLTHDPSTHCLLCSGDLTITALCEQADEQLFRTLKYNPIHPFIVSYHLSTAHHTSLVPEYVIMSYRPKTAVLTSAILFTASCTRTAISVLIFSLLSLFNSGLSVIFNKDYRVLHMLFYIVHI